MRAHIVITDDKGITFEGSVELVRAAAKKGRKSAGQTRVPGASMASLSFSMNLRAFMNKYGRNVSGPKKFALLLARLAQGKAGHDVSGETIVSAWNRMTGVLGPYNAAYSTRAKEQGWIDSPKQGTYSLSSSWKEALGTE